MPTHRMNIGPVPYEESCASLGFTPNFPDVARTECRAYRAAMIAAYGPPPEGARLSIASNPHDFGTYYEVELVYEGDIAEAVDYAIIVEQGLARWEDASFSAPYTYGDRGSIVEQHFPSVDHLIAKAIADIRDGRLTEPLMLERLTTSFPEATALAQSLSV